MNPIKKLDDLSLTPISLLALGLIALCVLGFSATTWQAITRSSQDLAELEHLNVQQSGSLTRLHIASLEGLNRLDRALERQLRPSLGDPVEALDAVTQEFDTMRQAYATFIAATQASRNDTLRATIIQTTDSLLDTMEAQLQAIQSGDRSQYRQLTLDAMSHSQAFSKTARAFYQTADERGINLLTAARDKTYRVGLALIVAIALTSALLLFLAWVGHRCVLKPLRTLGHHFQRLATGDLTQTVPARGNNEIGQLFNALGAMQGALTQTASRLHQDSQQVFDNAQKLSLGNEELAARTRQQSASLETTGDTLGDLTQSVGTTANHARRAASLSQQAVERAHRGDQVMADFTATMNDIRERSLRVDEIVTLIDAIAFQTNILALNASVEAARAGEHGRGFAVVAEEVRTLASRSADAARQIQTLLADSASSIATGHDLSTAASQQMRDIVAAIAQVNASLVEIDHAVAAQHASIAGLSASVKEQTTVTQANAAQVELTSQSAQALEIAAERMRQQANHFRIDGALGGDTFLWQANAGVLLSPQDDTQRVQALLQ